MSGLQELLGRRADRLTPGVARRGADAGDQDVDQISGAVRPIGTAADIGHARQRPQQVERLDRDAGGTAAAARSTSSVTAFPHQHCRAGVEGSAGPPGRARSNSAMLRLVTRWSTNSSSHRRSASSGSDPPPDAVRPRPDAGPRRDRPARPARRGSGNADRACRCRRRPRARLLPGWPWRRAPRRPAWPQRAAGGGCARRRRAACAVCSTPFVRRQASATLAKRRHPPYINRRRSPFMEAVTVSQD